MASSAQPPENGTDRRDRVVRAALDLAAAGQLGEQTMKRVAAKAQMSLSTVYAVIGSKQELLLLVAKTMQQQAADLTAQAGLGGRDREDSVAYALAPMLAAYDIFTADLGIGREIVNAGGMTDRVRVWLDPGLADRPDLKDSVTVLTMGYFGVLSARLAEIITDEEGRAALETVARLAVADLDAERTP